jgi:hypothetical protein
LRSELTWGDRVLNEVQIVRAVKGNRFVAVVKSGRMSEAAVALEIGLLEG